MDFLEFLAKIIDSIVWPACILLVLYMFRKELSEIILKLKTLQFKGFGVEFDEKSVHKVAEDSKSSLPDVSIDVAPIEHDQKELDNRLNFISEVAPRTAILEAWQTVEAAAVKALSSKYKENFKFYLGPMLGRYLVEAKILTKKQQDVFDRMRGLRNRVLHVSEKDLPRKAVDNYNSAAHQWVAYLEQRAKTP